MTVGTFVETFDRFGWRGFTFLRLQCVYIHHYQRLPCRGYQKTFDLIGFLERVIGFEPTTLCLATALLQPND